MNTLQTKKIEQLTRDECCLFLSAMRREREVCKQVMAESPGTVDIVKVCDEIIRKVKQSIGDNFR